LFRLELHEQQVGSTAMNYCIRSFTSLHVSAYNSCRLRYLTAYKIRYAGIIKRVLESAQNKLVLGFSQFSSAR